MVSLCERCRHNDWRRMQGVIDAFRDAGIPRPSCIWCAASDRPEDLRFEACRSFDELTHQVMRKARCMNKYQERLMDKPRIESAICPFCGRRAQSRHHIVPRSQGGAKGPTVRVCGLGNEGGCHGRFHHHTLHLDWNDEAQGWEYIRTDEPMKFEQARKMEGWMPLYVAKGGAA